MKKYYKNFKTKHMTVETMLTCAEKCLTSCSCRSACGGSIPNAAAIISIPNVGQTSDLVAIGSAVG